MADEFGSNHAFVKPKEAKISASGSSFAKVLRSYQTGGITYSDFLGHVNRYLAAGESPEELLEVLRRRQLIEPLPDFVHDAVASLVNDPTLVDPSLAATEEPAASEAPAELPTTLPPRAALTSASTAVVVRVPDELTDRVTPVAAAARPPVPAPDETVAIPRAASNFGDHAARPHATPFLEDDLPAAPAPPWRRVPWTRPGPWLSAALGLMIIGWVYHRSSTKPHAKEPTVDRANVAIAPAPAPAPSVDAEPGTVIQDCPTCPQMRVLPVGRFRQGSPYDDHDALPAEKPQHVVLIRHSVAMATTELTVDAFREFVTATQRELPGCEVYDGEWRHKADASWQAPGFTQGGDHPVTCVSWKDAVAYAEWLSLKTGHHYRLPSASEWEFAARSGSDAALPWAPGGQTACENANVADRTAARRYPKWTAFACKDGYVNTAPVGSFKVNAFGINDMFGNVFEWTQDCWHDDYVKAPIDGSARMDGDCSEHELRGGSWFSSPAFVRSAYRNYFAAEYRSASIGVRLVRDLAP